MSNDSSFFRKEYIYSPFSRLWEEKTVYYKATRVIDQSGRLLPIRIREGMGSLRCPACECENTHLEKASFHKGNDGYEARNHVRGDVVLINGCCEYGCLFTLFLGQHKGFTMLWCERQSYLVPECAAPRNR